MENNEVLNMNNGTESLSINSTNNGGELMPVNNQAVAGQQPSNLEMAASVAVTMAVGYGVGKLCEFLFDKVIGPTAKKVGQKFDDKMAKKAKKSKENSSEQEEDALEGDFEKINDPEETQDEQSTSDKRETGKKAVNAMRNNRKR